MKSSSSLILNIILIISVIILPHQVRTNPIAPSSENSPEYRREFIRNMTRGAWQAYVQIGWTNGTIRPVTRIPSSRNDKPARTIVAALTTLWTLGLKDEFRKAQEWVRDELHYKDLEYFVSVPSSVNDYLGSMLSSYALSGEEMFLERAKEIAEAIEPAYVTDTGLPMGRIKPHQKTTQAPNQFLSEIGAQHLEYQFLSDLTRSSEGVTPFERQKTIRKFLTDTSDRGGSGLFLSYLDVATGEWKGEQITMQAFAAAAFQYLVKAYLQSGSGDLQALEMYKRAIQSADQLAMFTTSRTGLLHIRDYYNESKRQGDGMTFEGCIFGSMCALGAAELQKQLDANPLMDGESLRIEQERISRHWELAKGITETCQIATNRTKTGLPLEKFYFNENEDAENQAGSYSYYYLRPQLAESFMVLWRLTKDEKYRDYAWRMVQKLYQYARTESGGYSSLLDVNSDPPELDDYQPPVFLGATLKYLYLTFAPDDALPLDQWVFNAAGHPLPICGKNTVYPKEKCAKRT